MSSPRMSSSGGGSRRHHYSRSPSNNIAPPSKRSKPSSSGDAGHGSDHHRQYTSICVKNINPKINDSEVRDLCANKFTKYGKNSVKIYYRNQERVAFVNFTNCDDARRACHARTGLVWDNIQVVLEPIYYRRTVPADQPLNPDSPRARSPPSPRRPPPRRLSPSPPPISSRSRPHHTFSPPRSRRHYSPFMPLPPELVDYVNPKPSRSRPVASPPRHRRRSRSRSRSASPVAHKSRSKYDEQASSRQESNIQHEPTRTLFVGNLERELQESALREIFGRYGTIEEIDLKVPQSSSKRAYAFIQYENMNMAYEARRAMDGRFIGKADCKIGYGKIVPTACLWVGNIPMEMKRRDLEESFARYGQMKSFDYANGDPIAVVSYNEIEDAIAARQKMTGVIEIADGRKVRAKPNQSDSTRRDGLRIDYLDRPTARRFVIVRPQDNTTVHRTSRSRSASSAGSARSPSPTDQARSITPDEPQATTASKQYNRRSRSRSPVSPPDKHRSPSPPIAGQTFYSPLGSYLSSDDTLNINDINELIVLCEKFSSRAKPNVPTAFSTQFKLKSHVFNASLHFLAGNPSLASSILGHPSDRASRKADMKITQRLRLDPHKFDELMKRLRNRVDDVLSNASSRRPTNPSSHMNFAVLITTPDASARSATSSSSKQRRSNGRGRSPNHSSDENDDRSRSRRDTDEDGEETSLSELITYLASKEAAGIINVPQESNDQDDVVVVNVYPPCQLTKKLLRMICPSISFSNGPRTPPSRSTAADDEHLIVIITNHD